MSSKSTLIITNDNEHFFEDCSEPLTTKEGVYGGDAITLEFDKKNIRIDCNDEWDLIITLINPDSEIYKLFKKIKQLK